jgi:hypothetical protein
MVVKLGPPPLIARDLHLLTFEDYLYFHTFWGMLGGCAGGT